MIRRRSLVMWRLFSSLRFLAPCFAMCLSLRFANLRCATLNPNTSPCRRLNDCHEQIANENGVWRIYYNAGISTSLYIIKLSLTCVVLRHRLIRLLELENCKNLFVQIFIFLFSLLLRITILFIVFRFLLFKNSQTI